MGGGTSRAGAAALVRGVLFFALWTGLIGTGHPLMGVATAALATAVSLRLLPPSTRLRLRRVPPFAVHFAWQSIAAGWDVARRALDPALPVRPGFVSYRARFRPGTSRNVFTLVTSLVPGTVPVGDDGESITYHCLDVGQPVAAQMATEEAILSRMLDEANAHE